MTVKEEVEKALAKLSSIELLTTTLMTEAIDKSYRKYLKLAQLSDVAIVRVGYYSMVMQIVDDDPFGVQAVQNCVVDHIILRMAELDDELEIVVRDLMNKAMEEAKLE
jgi:hypothetical protein